LLPFAVGWYSKPSFPPCKPHFLCSQLAAVLDDLEQVLRKLKFSEISRVLLIIATFQLIGCATTQSAKYDDELTQANATDPYEGFNRTMHNFNDGLDSYFLKPIVDGYKWITPDIVETGVSNVFLNMKGINVVLNDFLQGKLRQGAADTGRFLLNSTIGLGGIFDVATYAGLEQNDEDFGQTLAVWGVPSGPYLVLPLLGPSTFRGVPGTVFDTATNPISYLAWPVAAPIAAMAGIDRRATADSSLQFIDEAAVDTYVFTREAYLQHRNYLATDGKQEYSDDSLLDEFGDEEGEDLLSDTSDLDIEPINKQAQEYSLGKVAEAEGEIEQKRELEAPPNNVETKKPDVVQEQEKPPAFEKALRSFNKATGSYRKASDELEVIKKGGQQ
jgi:phospholipid-binding lipoprotein MlaA